ncbi:MAG: cation-translocating P-type ATPase [Weeksellaceae bacterium]
MIILLIIAASISLFIGEYIDGGLILLIVVLNASFGIYQEYKAEAAVAALKNMTVSKIRVIRDGKEQEIDSRYLVPGDTMLVEEGVKIPADAQILESSHLELNEAALTGESMPVVKSIEEHIYMGTIVAKGRATVRVVATGMETKFGQIAAELSSVEESLTPLQKKLGSLTEVIGLAGIVLSLIVFFLSTLQGNGYFPSFLLAVSLAVAVVPESLPAVMTVTLSVGVKHMAKRKAIIRKLAAIEALGSITLIATDKTGTLTENNMVVKELWADKDLTDVKAPVEAGSTEELMTLNGLLCSTASLAATTGAQKQTILGDPTEGALLLYGLDKGYNYAQLRREWELIEEVPFNSEDKRMTVVVKKKSNVLTLTKGAPESVLSVCNTVRIGTRNMALTEEYRAQINQQLDVWAAQGLRVLGFSCSPKAPKNPEELQDQVFLGLVALYDPPRLEAQDAIHRAQAAGIRVIMITGDNEKTAAAIGKAVGLLEEGDLILTGEQVQSYGDNELLEVLPKAKIFARVSPFHKSRIVSLYQKLGEIVAVTGDGVNDSIALKQADVGVAMGRVGTDVARETADMVITDDNFATIVNAVEEGRNIVKRLRHTIRYLLTGNLSEGLALLIGLLLGLPPILLPIQLLYINLISDGIPALALAFSPRDEHIMQEKPNKAVELLRRADFQYIMGIGGIVSCIVVFAYLYMGGETEIMARTAAFSVLAMIQAFIFIDIWWPMSHIRKHAMQFFAPIFIVTVSVPLIFQLIILRVPLFGEIFDITAVEYSQFLVYLGVSVLILPTIKILRRIFH